MSFEEFEDEDSKLEHSKLEPGYLKDFMETLTPDQRQMFTKIKRDYRRQISVLKDTADQHDLREVVFGKVFDALNRVGIADIEKGLREGLKKGDGQVLRLYLQSAGVDLSPQMVLDNNNGPVTINIAPHDEELEMQFVRVPDVAWKIIEEHLAPEHFAFVRALSRLPAASPGTGDAA